MAQAAAVSHPVLVAGGGPTGVRIAQELSRRGADVILLNAERWKPYNRVKLTPLLSGEAQVGQVYLPELYPGPGRVTRFDGVALTDIDLETRRALTSTGRIFHYSELVLALGSRAFIPNIPGRDLDGVYAFRDFNDAEALLARSMSARNVCVIGGGLLGLEAARGMAGRGANVTIVEHAARLMPRQLDADAAKVLSERISDLGIVQFTGQPIREITGEARVDGVALGDGTKIACDTVIVCAGVRANTQLAAGVGLRHNRGILVDDQMQTSDPHIYAVGECAEHNGIVQGLVGPCYDQAMVAAKAISGEEAVYKGSIPVTKLKVLGADVFSVGDFDSLSQAPGTRTYLYEEPENGIFRRIFVRRGRIEGALGVGEWPEVSRIQHAVTKRQSVYFWNLWQFQRTGTLWKVREGSVAAWPRDAVVCNCTGVSKGAILDAITLGSTSLTELRATTSANTVCGSCKEHVQELLGQGASAPEPVRWWKILLGLSGLGAVVALLTLMVPKIPLRETFVVGDLFTSLWFDTEFKQISGYSLLGISAVAALISFRKRIKALAKLGTYDVWRIAHLVLGLAAALGLVWHTGFRLGSNLNLLLMLSFLLTLITGAAAGLITGGEHELREKGVGGATPRAIPLWLHIIGVWPLPVLLAFHILSVYIY